MAIRDYLGRVYPGTAEEFASLAGKAMLEGKRLFVITANPEIIMHAGGDPAIQKMLSDPATAVVPDGISVVKAMGLLGYPAKERITGVDLAEKLLRLAGENGKRVCLLGAKEEVISAMAKKLKAQYPNMELWFRNGYGKDKDQDFQEIAQEQPDLVLVGLGVPAQEKLIARHLDQFQKGVFIGVGGSFDVLSGSKRRAPALFVKTNTEWLYRIAREPSRLGRFYRSNIKFLGQVRREAKTSSKAASR